MRRLETNEWILINNIIHKIHTNVDELSAYYDITHGVGLAILMPK